MAKTVSIIHILVSGKAAKDRLPEQPGQCVAAISARAWVGQNIARQRRQSQHVIEFAIGKQTGIGGHEPRNCSIRRRSKSSLSAPSFDSPAGFVMMGASMRE